MHKVLLTVGALYFVRIVNIKIKINFIKEESTYLFKAFVVMIKRIFKLRSCCSQAEDATRQMNHRNGGDY